MKKKDKEDSFWKILILIFSIFILSVACFVMLVYVVNNKCPEPEPPQPEPVYETILIELDNANEFEYLDGVIVDYTCDEGVVFNNFDDAFYASTLKEESNIMKGRCLIKVKLK